MEIIFTNQNCALNIGFLADEFQIIKMGYLP